MKFRTVTYMLVPRTVFDVVMHEGASDSDGSESVYSETIGTFDKDYVARAVMRELLHTNGAVTDGTKDMSDTFTRVKIVHAEEDEK